ncbi:hypothetical protein [Listeria sp. ILCC797]|uniref:hypothetical protein n=1 Tax=Listeria sp. ILCC797 TaxID=1918333 RepID=UPI000B58B4F2|nr:hypothetical protein [Listeria sp. ILCC797]
MKKMSAILLTIIVSLGMSNTVYATSPDSSNAKQILINFGYNPDVVDSLEETEINNYASTILENPDSIEIENGNVTTDNIEFIEEFLTTPEADLMASGIDETEIEEVHNELEELKEMSKEELHVSNVEYAVLQEALNSTPDNAPDEIAAEDTVTSSGAISTSTMSFSLTVVNKSTKTQPIYDVSNSFTWKKSFLMFGNSDKIGMAWSGNLNNRYNSSNLTYSIRDARTGGWFNNTLKKQTASTTTNPNKGLIFSFSQSKNKSGSFWRVKSGTVKTQLFQTKKKGVSQKLATQYAHAKAGASGISISTGGVGVNIGTKYDKSSEQSKNITN